MDGHLLQHRWKIANHHRHDGHRPSSFRSSIYFHINISSVPLGSIGNAEDASMIVIHPYHHYLPDHHHLLWGIVGNAEDATIIVILTVIILIIILMVIIITTIIITVVIIISFLFPYCFNCGEAPLVMQRVLR